MAISLPPWVVDNDASIEAEAAPWRTVSIEDKGRAMRDACATAGRFTRARADAERVYAWRDPLPDSTIEALRRLQAAYKRERQG